MVRTLQPGGRGERDALAPIERPRLVARLAAAHAYPVGLLIAPAGYGKSVALRQYLASLDEPYVRFALRPEHATLLGFLRGFSEALGDHAPHAAVSLAGAYEKATPSSNRAEELAAWIAAHMEEYHGLVAIDDLHVADADRDVTRVIVALIEKTKENLGWFIASRSTTNLPIGSWLAYRDADLPVNEHDLSFTFEETREAADAMNLTIADAELGELLSLTEGWPAALSFALRMSTRSSELRNVSALTREMSYRLLAEQVYDGLDAQERDFLDVAMALPAIDVNVLQRAGFDHALTIAERLRQSTALIHEESAGIYQCHDLFRDFLRRQSALTGRLGQQDSNLRAARALESGGDVEHAIGCYIAANAPTELVRLLERRGFDLLERAHGDVVGAAIVALDDKTRRENAYILALQGTLHAIAGRFSRAEALLRRALARAGSDRELVATASLRLAAIIGNQGGDVTALLTPIVEDDQQHVSNRAEALSLIAARQAMSGKAGSAAVTATAIEKLLPEVNSDLTRARILQRLGILYKHIRKIEYAFARLAEAAQVALEGHFFSVTSRAFSVLSNLALRESEDQQQQLYYAQRAADAAAKAGDTFGFHTALVQILSAAVRTGDSETAISAEQRLVPALFDPAFGPYIAFLRAVRVGWERQYGVACALLSNSWDTLIEPVDRVNVGAHFALFLALDGRKELAAAQLSKVLQSLRSVTTEEPFDARTVTMSYVLCALGEIANGRLSIADRILRQRTTQDMVQRSAVAAARHALRLLSREETESRPKIFEHLAIIRNRGYGDWAKLCESVVLELIEKKTGISADNPLTRTEREVLRQLADGLLPKEIAIQTKRSISTVRAHVTNATLKLGCRSRSEAVYAARRRGLI